jgi:pyruvate formate lyase activating enzyme
MLEACRDQGIRTAVDTCGFGPTARLLALAPLTDLFLYDLKLMDQARHRHFCGASNVLILDNLKALAQTHANVWIRIPLIPGINDQPEELAAMAEFVQGLQSIKQVNLLPYHRIGVHKFARLGRKYRLPELNPPSTEQVRRALDHFLAAGLNAVAGPEISNLKFEI